jgi:hypothetical protein
MLHLGGTPQEVKRDIEIVDDDRQMRLNQIVLREMDIITK